jgi:hypothetical protein
VENENEQMGPTGRTIDGYHTSTHFAFPPEWDKERVVGRGGRLSRKA